MKNLLIACLGTVSLMSPSLAREILVDSSQKLHDSQPTIQAAIDIAEPGDTVEISGGVYFEPVLIKQSGLPGLPITVQGAPNELVLINAGKPLEATWQPVPEMPEVFVTPVPGDLLTDKSGIWETPSRLRLAKMSSVAQVAARLGSWYLDSAAGKLYLRSSGMAPSDQLIYWIESPKKSAVTVEGAHIVIRNLQTTLGQNGILVVGKKTSHVVVEGCRAFCNSWAGIHVTGDDHVIRHNEAFENNTYGIQLRFGVNRVHVLNNICLYNGPNNGEVSGSSVPTDLGIYSQGGYNLFEGNLAEGAHEDVYRNKTGHGANATNVLRNNVIKGNQTPSTHGVYDNTLLVSGLGMRAGMYRNGGPPGPMRSWENVDPTGIQRASNLIYPLAQDQDPHFSDPSYRDYRLQTDSPYLGRGAYPGREPVYYVDPKNGSDKNTGLSLAESLATPQAAVDRMGAGATIYLLPGDYAEALNVQNGGLDAWNPLRIRAYGKSEKVKLTGAVKFSDGQFVEIEGLEFGSTLELENYAGAVVKNCVFSGPKAGLKATKSPMLTVDRCTFVKSQAALQLAESPQAKVIENLFVDGDLDFEIDTKSAEKYFSDYNAFTHLQVKVGSNALEGLSAWQSATGRDGHSWEGAIPLGPNFESPSRGPLAMLAADFSEVGARRLDRSSELDIINLRVAGLSPEGATLLWETPHQATFAEITLKSASGETIRSWEPSYRLLVMASSFDITRMMEAFYSSDRHAGMGDLTPGTKYIAEVVVWDLQENRSEPQRVEFETPKTYADPATYYLSPEGKDTADGKGRTTAWKSFAYALAQVRPGDEVVLLPGKYHEILRPRVSGTPDHKITIRAENPQEAILDLAESIPVAVEILNADHITIDGMLIANGFFARTQAFLVNHAKGITVQNCEIDYPAVATFEKLKLGYSGLVAHESPDLTVENNLFLCSVWGVAASHSSGAVIHQNTFVGEGNYGVVLIPGSPEDTYAIEDNIFYQAVMGYKTGPCIWIFPPMCKVVSDHNLFYIPEDHKGTIGALVNGERHFPLTAWVKASGLDKNSQAAQPVFVDPEHRDFTLKADSPGKGMAKGGGDVGRIRKQP